MKRRITGLALALLGVQTSMADTIIVEPGESIQAALDGSIDGDTVELASGSWQENLIMPGHALVVRGTVDGFGQPASSIDGDDGQAIVINDNLHGVSFENLVISGQDANTGGGAYIYRSNPSFTNCRFANCDTDGAGTYDGGGAVYIFAQSPTHRPSFDNCVFADNSAHKGGAIGFRSGSGPYQYSASVTNCIFQGNTANYGGAICSIYLTNLGVDIEQCLFFDNTAVIDGSAIAYTSVISTSIGNSAFCGLEPIISGTWEDLGGNCFSETCEDLDGDMIPDECDDSVDEGCTADTDGDGVVGVLDLLKIIEDWGTPDSDLNGDGTTDVLDLLQVIEQWGSCP